MKYFLALDIGGTKTACVLANESAVMGRSRSDSAKVLRIGKDDAARHLRAALDSVSRESGVALADITASCIGTSGAAVAEVVDWLREQMETQVGGSIEILGDEEITLDAAFPGGAGVVVIAGTGSNVIGRTRKGWTAGAGGWGPALADEGSGNLLGQQTLRAIFAAINDGEEPELLAKVLNHLKLRTRDELIAVANAPNFEFAQLIPVVLRAARSGDEIAMETLKRGGEELGGLVLRVIRRLIEKDPGLQDHLEVACTGSIMEHVAEVRRAMEAMLMAAHPRLIVLPGTVDPLDGALWHARRVAGKV
jgi:glucosamine kinase